MEFIIQKESVIDFLRLTEHISAIRGIQPVLSNVFIKAVKNEIILKSTDLDLGTIIYIEANVEKEGEITLPAKKLSDLISRFPDKEIKFSLNSTTNVTSITCANSKFDLLGISASEFPQIVDEKEVEENKERITIEIEPFIKSIKLTSYSTINYESNNVLSGVLCSISDKHLELVSTDGNRLSRVVEKIESALDKEFSTIIPSKTLNEFVRMAALFDEKTVDIIKKDSQVIFKFKKAILVSRVIEGQYPKYKQLIPENNQKFAIVSKEDLINALERTALIAEGRTNIVKMTFENNQLMLEADNPEVGDCVDLIDVKYDSEKLRIAFNYKYLLEALKYFETPLVKFELNTPLSATLVKPNSSENYLALIMPVQIRE
ncbi:MAG: DNA polymerase III subunit beta [Candidatus Gastranaerophilales bacterium]|nr:DNA polymerase III subunit beta [Candidatus Gastranaerophilales bacterium]